MVVILQSHHEGDESVGGNLKGLEQLTLLKIAEVGQSGGQLFITMDLFSLVPTDV